MKRDEVLEAAAECVKVSREETYGDARETLGLIADLWSAYLGDDIELGGYDVAMMMTLLKVARAKRNTQHVDNLVDGAGYLALAAELAP